MLSRWPLTSPIAVRLPVNVALPSSLATLALNRVSGTVPSVSADASRFTIALPSPESVPPLPRGWPSTVTPAPPVSMRTPPDARTLNWLSAVEVKSTPVESAQTNAPELVAFACRPAAKL